MKVIGWNVNGIRAQLKKGFLEWLSEEDPDILCIQETKCHPDQLAEDVKNISPYKSYWSAAEKKGYSGVAVYTKETPIRVLHGIGDDLLDSEGRTLMLEFENFILYNIYYPNGGSGNKRVPFKMSFYDAFLKHVELERKSKKKIIITGDFNTAHHEIDLARPKQNEKNTGFLPEEREWMTKFENTGYVDTFRFLHKEEEGCYTWWDYKTRARDRNVGWRIDYFFATQECMPQIQSAFILSEKMGSDHCPVGVNVDFNQK